MVHNPADWTVSPHNSGRLDSENAFHDCLHSLYVTVDLLQNYPITGVTVWHFHGDPRQYCNQKIALSTTGAFAGEEDIVYETGPEYGPPESAEGIRRIFPPTEARYVRHWCGRSTTNAGVHFLEMDVYSGEPRLTSPPLPSPPLPVQITLYQMNHISPPSQASLIYLNICKASRIA